MSPWYRYVIRFTIRPNARNLIDNAEAAVGVLAIHVQATPEIAAISDARHLVCSLHFARMPGSAHVLKVRRLSGRSLNTRKKSSMAAAGASAAAATAHHRGYIAVRLGCGGAAASRGEH
jgi:hypothetical protein